MLLLRALKLLCKELKQGSRREGHNKFQSNKPEICGGFILASELLNGSGAQVFPWT